MLPLLKKFPAFLPDGPRVLDLCCGAGHESMRLMQLGAQVVGLDVSPASITREKNSSLSFFVGDMLADYRQVDAVDGIVCIAGLCTFLDQAPGGGTETGRAYTAGGA